MNHKPVFNQKNSFIVFYFVLFIGLLVFWESSATNKHVRLLLSSPSLSWNYFLENFELFKDAIITTFSESILGLCIAIGLSFTIMTICFYWPSFMKFILPLMIGSQVIPLITLAPLFIIVFGPGILSKVLMSALLCFFPLFVSFANGVKLIPVNIHEFMFINNVTTRQKILYAYFPLSVPHIMSGLKVSATLSVIGAIVGEMTNAQVGLGKNLYISAMRLEPELMICSTICSAILGGVMYMSIYLLEKWLGSWYL